MFRLGSVLAAGLLCAVPAAAQTYGEWPFDTSTCRDISGQAEIDGVTQPFTGHACQQSDGSWVLVNDDGDYWISPVSDYGYYGYWAPVYWGPTFIFFDRFHHPHFRPFPGHFIGTHSGFHSHPVHSWGGGDSGGMRHH
jgi:hypothetical protein